MFCSVREMKHHLISQIEHLNTSDTTSHGTESFRAKPITPIHPIPKISTCLSSERKTEFVKAIDRQERTSSEKKIRRIPQEMLNTVLENVNVRVAAVLSYSSDGAWNEHSIYY